MADDYDDEELDLNNDAEQEEFQELDLTPRRIPVRIKGVDGVTRLYQLRDLIGITRDRYLTNQLKRARKKGPDGKAGSGATLEGYQSELIALTLWDLGKHVEVTTEMIDGVPVEKKEVVLTLKDDDATPVGESRVPQKLIDSWPARVQKWLFEKSQEVAGLDKQKDETEQEEKND